MTQTEAQKMVNRALSLKAKQEKSKARYERRRKRYHEAHKKIMDLINSLVNPLKEEFDQIKLALEQWRDQHIVESTALTGVSWRTGKYSVTSVNLEDLIRDAVSVNLETGDIIVESVEFLAPNNEAISKRVKDLELMHGIPGVTVKKELDTAVFSTKDK